MITSMKLTGDPNKLSEYHSHEENYYFNQGENFSSVDGNNSGPALSHVSIHGGLTWALGFEDGQNISKNDLSNLLSGMDKSGNKATKKHKVHGVDLTFSAPKSVSVAGLLTVKDPRITEAHSKAVLDVMKEIERVHAGTQPKAGVHEKTGNLAYVTVLDGLSREKDPHVHTHVVVANMTKYGDKIMALDGREIMAQDFNKAWGAVYRNRLAGYLKDIGYSISYTKKGDWRMDAVSQDVERAFSRRRNQIKSAKNQGILDMDAWRKTRKDKEPTSEKEGIIESWKQRLAFVNEAGTESSHRLKAEQERKEWVTKAQFSVEAKQEQAGERKRGEVNRWQLAAKRASERTATPTKQAILMEYFTELAYEGVWSVSYDEAQNRFEKQLEKGHFASIGQDRFSTWEMVRMDREYFSHADYRTDLYFSEEGSGSKINVYLKQEREKGHRILSEQQKVAVSGILEAQEGVVVVQGDAGAGKTTMLKAVNEIAKSQNWEMLGLAVQGVAARKLQEESGLPSMTLAAYLSRERGEASKARLIVFDEASMLDSRGAAQLMAEARSHGDKVVFVGDKNQLESVGAGRPFDRLVGKAENEGKIVSLTENFRQKDPVLREVVDLAKKGDMRESLKLLDSRHQIYDVEKSEDRHERMAGLYSDSTLIITGTVAAREKLNWHIRQSLAKRGNVSKDESSLFSVARLDQDGVEHEKKIEFSVGDKVAFLRNEYKHLDVRNGERGEILGISEKSLTVRLEDERVLKVDTSQYKHLDYGYAMTTYKSQGQTFDQVVVEADTRIPSLNDMRNQYVQVTRAREDIKIFTDDKKSLIELAGVGSTKRDTLDLKESYEKAVQMEKQLAELATEQDLIQKTQETSFGKAMKIEEEIKKQQGRSGPSIDI